MEINEKEKEIINNDNNKDVIKRKTTIKASDLSEDERMILKTLRSYYKILQETKDVSYFLEDDTFNNILVTLMDDRRHSIITYLTKILLILTEKVDNARKIASISGLQSKLASATEHDFPPKVLKYLLVVQSRLESSKLQRNTTCRNLSRKMFYLKDAKQLVYQFDELSEKQRDDVEKALLSLKGVLSVSVDTEDLKCIVRVKEIVESRDVAYRILTAGFDMIKQIISTSDGEMEIFEFYRDQLHDDNLMDNLPQYLDEHVDIFNPENCIITNDDLRKAESSSKGWFSTITSYLC
ncbi:Hypothetical protein SRAE_2000040700 [Strongyloides ratti]|uniref:Armadillo-like helical domain and Armadillo-type fold domain-containing protein n=1 Tax=Strongyloides ratti TaxID=34506 RepID=A0A090L7I8_STRRB|nr:Hypothetical protein SRAE_2000040700 [Strongyloides ratti]CEF65731.1 Hypothetical protein SRAE_2000040700 [Strongyloides ratti]